MTQRSDGLARLLLLLVRGAVFLVPLVALLIAGELFFPRLFYPYITWRAFVFRYLVEAMVGLWIVLAWLEPRYRPRKSWISLALTAFIGVLIVADLFGVNPSRSIWSNFERMEGLVGLLHLFGFFLVASSVLDSRKQWKIFGLVCLAVCLFVSGDAIRQFIAASQKERLPFLQDITQKWAVGRAYFRVDARVASPVYLGVFQLFHVFLAVLFVTRAKSLGARLSFGAMAALSGFVLYSTGTRIAYLGLLAGAGLTVALVSLRSDSPVVRRRARTGLIAFAIASIVLGSIVVFYPQTLSRVPILNRVVIMGEAESSATRFALWQMVWEGFWKHPILGWGQENFLYVFGEFFHPALFGRDVPSWWDHPHNVVLHWLVSGGLLGCAAYLSVLFAGFWVLWKGTRLTVLDKSIVTGALAGYLVFNMAQLDNLTSYVMFFAALAWIHSMSFEGDAAPAPAPVRSPLATTAVVGVMSVLVGVTMHYVNTVNLRTAKAYQDIADNQQLGNPGAAYEATLVMLDGGPIGRFEVRENLANSVAELLGGRLPRNYQRTMVDVAAKELRAIVDVDPNNIRALTRLGLLLRDSGRVADGVVVLERARDIAPKRQELLFDLAYAYVLLSQNDKASALFREGWQLRPQNPKGRLGALVGAVYARDRELEDEILALLMRDKWHRVFAPPEEYSVALLQMNQADRLIGFLKPNYDAWKASDAPEVCIIPRQIKKQLLVLKNAYVNAGETQKALDLISEMVKQDPQFAPRGRRVLTEIRQHKAASEGETPPK